EETLEGKLKMIAASMFEGCDIALSWHPGDCNMTYDKAYLACTTAYYEFHGQTSHAGFAPEKGRSALDAVELMSVGCNYLREHVVDHTRIHYTTYSGGFPPNIVPDKASAKYCIRALRMSDVKDTLRRVDLVAQGAAMMSETEVTIHHGFGGYELLENKHLASLNYQNLLEAPAPKYTDEELTFAKQLQQTLPASSLHVYDEYQANQIIFQGVAPRHAWKDHPVYASSDSGDVSYIMPTGLFNTACYPVGCAPHTWQVCSSVGMSIGEKGALYAAQVLAGSAFDLLTNEKIRNDIIDEFTRYNDGTYQTMLPDE
ncbi:MAG: peptidase dimerization domain-containing protein, partial [Faecalibacillus sp.]